MNITVAKYPKIILNFICPNTKMTEVQFNKSAIYFKSNPAISSSTNIFYSNSISFVGNHRGESANIRSMQSG